VSFDLAIVVAALAAQGVLRPEELGRTVLLGELGLDGLLRPVRGILPATLAAQQAGFTRVIVPLRQAGESQLVSAEKARHRRPATPPIGKPYPQCTSGMAYDASTMPESVATFRPCSKDLSARASGSRPDVANTMPGTRIGGSSSIRKRWVSSTACTPVGVS
jgi:Subunit ChlI of Mg-chelatase